MGIDSKNRRLFFILLILATFFVLLDSTNIASSQVNAVKNATTQIFKPLQSGISSVVRPLGDWFTGITSAGKLKRENESLKKELDRLKANEKKAKAAIAENKRLSKQLKLKIPDDIKRKSARVIAGSPSNFQWTIQIDKGSNDGIKLGMPVMSGEGLIGKIYQVSKNNSTVLLINDPTFAVGAQSTRSGVKGIIKGKSGGTTLSLQFIDDLEKIKKGDSITTTGGDESLFPAGLEVGVVKRKTSTDVEVVIPRLPEEETVVSVLLSTKE